MKLDFEKEFAIFILSHNRAEKIDTLDMLQKAGYNGSWYVVISTDNEQIEKYKQKIPQENLLIFNKEDIVVDTMLSRHKFEPRSAVYARNFIANFAKDKYKYFLMSDDDIKDIKFKLDINGHIKDISGSRYIHQIIEELCSFLESSEKLAGTALAIGNGYFGGVRSIYKIEREVCCFMVFKSSHLRPFRGIQCEDVILSCDNFDQVYLTYRGACVIMPQRGSNAGGNDYDTKKLPPNLFWHVVAPSSVKVVGQWGRIRYNKKMYPQIISDKYKK